MTQTSGVVPSYLSPCSGYSEVMHKSSILKSYQKAGFLFCCIKFSWHSPQFSSSPDHVGTSIRSLLSITLPHCLDPGKKKHFCSSAALLLFFSIFRQEYCILSWCVEVREINPERSMNGIQYFWAVKILCGSLLTSCKIEENPGVILAFVLDMEGLLEGCEMGAVIHRNLRNYPCFYRCFLIFGCCFSHVPKIDAFPSQITEFLRLEKTSQSPMCA